MVLEKIRFASTHLDVVLQYSYDFLASYQTSGLLRAWAGEHKRAPGSFMFAPPTHARARTSDTRLRFSTIFICAWMSTKCTSKILYKCLEPLEFAKFCKKSPHSCIRTGIEKLVVHWIQLDTHCEDERFAHDFSVALRRSLICAS